MTPEKLTIFFIIGGLITLIILYVIIKVKEAGAEIEAVLKRIEEDHKNE